MKNVRRFYHISQEMPKSAKFYHIREPCFQLDYVAWFQAYLQTQVFLGSAHLGTLIKVNIRKEKKIQPLSVFDMKANSNYVT